jgi:hypothetical protein
MKLNDVEKEFAIDITRVAWRNWHPNQRINPLCLPLSRTKRNQNIHHHHLFKVKTLTSKVGLLNISLQKICFL